MSVTVVADVAPMWKIVSTSSPFAASQDMSSAGATCAATGCFSMTAVFSGWSRTSQTTISVSPRSASAATRFDPINPAPPVTTIMQNNS